MINKAKLRELCETTTIKIFSEAIPALLDEIDALEKKVAEARAETWEKAINITSEKRTWPRALPKLAGGFDKTLHRPQYVQSIIVRDLRAAAQKERE